MSQYEILTRREVEYTHDPIPTGFPKTKRQYNVTTQLMPSAEMHTHVSVDTWVYGG